MESDTKDHRLTTKVEATIYYSAAVGGPSGQWFRLTFNWNEFCHLAKQEKGFK